MPIYEYRCPSCGREFEELVWSAEADGPPCPACGAVGAERKLSVFAARQGGDAAAAFEGEGGCGRCGDPNGPCGL